MTIVEALITPFSDYAFMRRALAACVALAIGGAPLGVFMAMRRMTLVGDAMSHAIMPGVAAAFLAFGMSLWPMTAGAVITGLAVAGAALTLTRFTSLREDSAFTLLYLPSIAVGIILISLKQGSGGADMAHLLFGNILAIDAASLAFITASGCLSVMAIAAFYRRFVMDCFDPDFMSAAASNWWTNYVFFGLLMANLVAAFQVLGTLMALGMTVLPAMTARFLTRNMDACVPLAIAIAMASSIAGLLLSYHFGLPPGPAVVALAGCAAILSAVLEQIAIRLAGAAR